MPGGDHRADGGGGTLQEPEASLFSDLSVERARSPCYLLTGRPLESGSKSDASRIAQALALYGLEKGSGVTEKIGDKIGLDDISVPAATGNRRCLPDAGKAAIRLQLYL